MATRDEFLRPVWDDLVNASMAPGWAEAMSRPPIQPDVPFADTTVAFQRVLAAGADPRDLGLIVRQAVYEATFNLLSMLDDPGVDGDDGEMLFESLLSADPSGLEGRPGSSP